MTLRMLIKVHVSMPIDWKPADEKISIDAKMVAGNFTPGPVPYTQELKKPQGRRLDE